MQHPPDREYDPKYMRKKDMSLSGKVSLWGCISAQGLGQFAFYDDPLNAEGYVSILKNNLKNSYSKLFTPGAWFFQHDNWAVHRAAPTRTHLFTTGIEVLKWPPYSPDLNPIENLWNDLKRRVYARHPKTIVQLKKFIMAEWKATTVQYASNLCRSMPVRLELLVANGGHRVKY